MNYFIVFFRSVFFYLLIALVYRLMGKREIGELSIMDFIVSIFIAEMVAISIENYSKSIFLSLVPIFALVIMQIIFSYISMKSEKTRKILDGKPSIIIERGKINFSEMKKQRYNLDDLLMQLRSNSVKSIEDVDYAILEANGKLSIFQRMDDPSGLYPLPLILDGKVEENTLIHINKTEKWLKGELKKQHTSIENVFYCFYKQNNLYIILNDKIK